MPTQQLLTEQSLSPSTMSQRSIPKLEPKLVGQHNYAGRQKGRRGKENGVGDRSKEGLVVLKAGSRKKDNGKSCISKPESEWFTKKREKGKGSMKKAKAANTSGKDSDGNMEGAIVLNVEAGIRGVGASDVQTEGYFQYDCATTHHTTNRLDLLQDIKTHANFSTKAHDGSISYCEKIGTLVFHHNGEEIRHQECLYKPNFSNLISGQRMGQHVLTVGGDQATLKKGKRVIYQMDVDQQGALWIKLEKSQAAVKQANTEVIKDPHERNHDQNLPQQRALDTWKGVFVEARSKVLQNRRRSPPISDYCRRTAVYNQNDETRDHDPSQSVETTNLKSIDKHKGSTGSLVVFAVDEIRRSHFAQTRQSRPGNIHRGPKGRRGSKTTDMSHNGVGKATDRMVQPAAGRSLSVDNTGRIHRRLQGGKGYNISTTTPPRAEHTYSPDLEDGQQRGIQPQRYQIPPPEPPHGAAIPISPTRDYTNDPREGEPYQFPHQLQAQPDEHGQSLESSLDEYSWMELFGGGQLNNRMALLNDEQLNEPVTLFNDEQLKVRMAFFNDGQLNEPIEFFNDEQLNDRML